MPNKNHKNVKNIPLPGILYQFCLIDHVICISVSFFLEALHKQFARDKCIKHNFFSCCHSGKIYYLNSFIKKLSDAE